MRTSRLRSSTTDPLRGGPRRDSRLFYCGVYRPARETLQSRSALDGALGRHRLRWLRLEYLAPLPRQALPRPALALPRAIRRRRSVDPAHRHRLTRGTGSPVGTPRSSARALRALDDAPRSRSRATATPDRVLCASALLCSYGRIDDVPRERRARAGAARSSEARRGPAKVSCARCGVAFRPASPTGSRALTREVDGIALRERTSAGTSTTSPMEPRPSSAMLHLAGDARPTICCRASTSRRWSSRPRRDTFTPAALRAPHGRAIRAVSSSAARGEPLPAPVEQPVAVELRVDASSSKSACSRQAGPARARSSAGPEGRRGRSGGIRVHGCCPGPVGANVGTGLRFSVPPRSVQQQLATATHDQPGTSPDATTSSNIIAPAALGAPCTGDRSRPRDHRRAEDAHGSRRRGLRRFKTEFRAVADLAPDLDPSYELQLGRGIWFFTMEHIDGVDFLEWLRGPSAREAPRSGKERDAGGDDQAARRRAQSARPVIRPTPAPPDSLARVRRRSRQLVRGVRALHQAGSSISQAEQRARRPPKARSSCSTSGLVRPVVENAGGARWRADEHRLRHACVDGAGQFAGEEHQAGRRLVRGRADALSRALTGLRVSARERRRHVVREMHLPPVPRRLVGGVPPDLLAARDGLAPPNPERAP